MIDDLIDDGFEVEGEEGTDEEIEEILGLPSTSSMKTIALVREDLGESRLCVVTCIEDEEGVEKVHSRIDFDSPEEVVNFAKSLVNASKQTFQNSVPQNRLLH